MNYDDYLAHYGVKGMKWGVRKDRKRKSSSGDSERSTRRKKVLKKVATAAAVAGVATAGAYAVYKFGPDIKQTAAGTLDNASRTRQGRDMLKNKDFSDSMKFAMAMDAQASRKNYNRLRTDAKSTVIREDTKTSGRAKNAVRGAGDRLTAYRQNSTPDQIKRDRRNRDITKEQGELYRDQVFGRSNSKTSRNRASDKKRNDRQETIKTARQTAATGATAFQNVRKDVRSGTTMDAAVKREAARVGLDYVNNLAEKKLKEKLG